MKYDYIQEIQFKNTKIYFQMLIVKFEKLNIITERVIFGHNHLVFLWKD